MNPVWCEPPSPLALPPVLQQHQPARHQLWILAASLGGPAAVNRFLGCLPSGLPCSFLYAQHIHAEFQPELLSSATRRTELAMVALNARSNSTLQPGTVYVAPVEHSIALRHEPHINEFCLTDQPWRGPYSPCFDQLMETLVQNFQGDCHVIVFSGMTGDALVGSRAIRAGGGEVWVQRAEGCIQPAMPNAVLEAGHSTHQGDPAALAQDLIHHLQALTEHNQKKAKA